MDDELIKFKEVNKSFGKRVILDSISFTVPEKKITGIIGASGEGKTTLLKLLIGLHIPTKGEILYSKRNIHDDLDNIKRIFGFATEDGSFHDRLTVFENMVHFGRLYHLSKKDILERTHELLEFVGLTAAKDTMGSDLSMGMKKRLDIAISLLHNPEVLILDEPTADLDPLLRRNMLELIKKINKTGTTIIITTQLLGEMDKICDKIAILFGKKIIGEGTLEEIKAKYSAKDMNHVFDKIFAKQENSEKSQKVQEKSKTTKPEEEPVIDSNKDIHDPLYTQSIKDYVSEEEE